ncbi:MAG: hypothetical protein IPO07_17385 [Haliscomenobacter sp.]|nr:hypothetical protein [Haliscomenobacter sp.]MBK9490349.1 hypothetical protein [Haliscomenobacter sp.]
MDCYDVDYVLNNKLTIGNVGSPQTPITSSPRPSATATDGRTITNAEGDPGVGDNCQQGLTPPNLVSDAVKNLGYAYYEDNCRYCNCRTTLKWTDKVIFFACTDPEFRDKGCYAKIEREWVATDCKGMRADAYIQDIYFERPALDLSFESAIDDDSDDDLRFEIGKPDDRDVEGEEGVELDEVGYNWTVTYQSCTADKSLILHDDVTPFFTGYFDTDNNPRKIYIDKLECNYSVTTKDTEFPICGGKGVKIDRELYVFDCAGKVVDTFHILIKIGDFKAPILTWRTMHHLRFLQSNGLYCGIPSNQSWC